MKKRIITSTAFAACLALCAAMWPQNDPAVETSVLPTPPAVIAAQPEVSEMPEIEEIIMPEEEKTEVSRHERRGVPHGAEGPKLEAAAHEHHRRVHEMRRRQGRFRFPNGVRGLRRPLGEQPQIHHLHHAGQHEVPRQQITRRKVLQGGHGA